MDSRKDNSDDNVEKTIRTSGGIAFSKGVEHTVAAATGNPDLGKAAGVAAGFVPDHVKTGAAVGGLLGGGIAGHAITIGTAGAFAMGMAVFIPFILGGAVIAGGAAWLLGSDEKKDKNHK